MFMPDPDGGHFEHPMASHRLCLRFTFLCVVTLSLCSIVFITMKGTRLIYSNPTIEFFDGYNFPHEVESLQDLLSVNDNESDIYRNRTCHPNIFGDILLVIAFVEASYDSIPMLERLYRKRFPNILYCGPAKPRIESVHNIMTVSMFHGVIVYECLGHAIRTHSNFAGFLFVRSDLFTNFWSLVRFDKSRIWEAPDELGSQVMFKQPRDPWIWWYTPWGLKACERVYKDLIYLNDVNRRAMIDSKGEKESVWDVEAALNALLWNGGAFYKCYRGQANIFYIPSKYAVTFEKLSGVFQKNQVFTEIAVPTIIRMLELTEKNVKLRGVDLAAFYGEEKAQRDSTLFWRHFVPNASYIRPVIFTNTSRTHSSFLDILISRLNHTHCSERTS